MSTLDRELRDQRARTWHRMKDILDRAGAARRDLTADEQLAWDDANAELDLLDQRLAAIADDDRRAADAQAALARVGAAVPVARAALSGRDADLDTAFREAVVNNSRRPIVVPAESRAWQPGLEARDLTTSGNVGTTFGARIVRHLVESGAVLSAGATLLAQDSGETFKVPRSTAHSTAAIVAEAGAIGESDPTLGTVTMGSFKYGFLVQVTNELVADAAFDLLGYLAEQAGVAIGTAAGAHFANGTGTGQPRGVVLESTAGVTGGTGVAGAFTADNLIDVYHSLAEPYARSQAAGWLMRNATLAAVRKLKDSQNRYLFSLDVPAGSGAAGTLLGRPVWCDPSVPAVGLSAASVVFGDFSRYWVRSVGGIRFERSDDYAFGSDLVTFRGLSRLDGAAVDTSAFKHFAGGAS